MRSVSLQAIESAQNEPLQHVWHKFLQIKQTHLKADSPAKISNHFLQASRLGAWTAALGQEEPKSFTCQSLCTNLQLKCYLAQSVSSLQVSLEVLVYLHRDSISSVLSGLPTPLPYTHVLLLPKNSYTSKTRIHPVIIQGT